MRILHKLIKLFAFCLAAAIIVGLFAAIVGGITWLDWITNGGESGGEIEAIWSGDNSDARKITKLEIKTGATSTRLVQTEELNISVETNNKHITTREIGNTLYIEEESHFDLIGAVNAGTTVISIPRTIKLSDVKISVGAGAFTADEIKTASIEFHLGAGKTKVGKLIVTENARIEGGAGSMEIDDGEIHNLRLELGVGKTRVKAKVLGDSKVESGVGRLDLILVGGKDRYKFRVDKGVGTVTIDGVNQSDDAVYGQGNNLIELESGVGAVEVNFAE